MRLENASVKNVKFDTEDGRLIAILTVKVRPRGETMAGRLASLPHDGLLALTFKAESEQIAMKLAPEPEELSALRRKWSRRPSASPVRVK